METQPYENNSYRDPKDNKFWKRVPIDITDEDYVYLKKIHNQYIKNEINIPKAKIAGIIVIVIGFILTLMVSSIPIIGIYIGLGIGISSILFGILYITLGNILLALNRIYDTIKKNGK